MQKELQRGGSGRERLLWRLNMCRLLIEAKKARLAVPHLEKILAEIDRFDLEHWEPELALDGLRVVWLGFSELADEKHQPRIDEALDRIAGLSPAGGPWVWRGCEKSQLTFDELSCSLSLVYSCHRSGIANCCGFSCLVRL